MKLHRLPVFLEERGRQSECGSWRKRIQHRSSSVGRPSETCLVRGVAGYPVALPPPGRCCRQLALRPPGRALVGGRWRGLGRRPAMAGVTLEIAYWAVCRSRRWCPTGRFFRAAVFSRRPCPHPAKGDIRMFLQTLIGTFVTGAGSSTEPTAVDQALIQGLTGAVAGAIVTLGIGFVKHSLPHK
jgi:hypothetical protein